MDSTKDELGELLYEYLEQLEEESEDEVC